jgi:preprotein translocase subunit SecA
MLKNPFKKSSLNKYQNLINQINTLESELTLLTDSDLRAKSLKLKKQYQESQNLDSLIAESFALTREASKRTLGLRHYDVQLIGGLVLNDQKIAEMKTGEGKTLVATLPAVLNALTKKGVHIVTVNDYLANRDQVSMGQIYRFLGLSTGLIQEGMSKADRRKNYNADITYVTNYEVTFDFLRDNMALNLNDLVLRPFYYCIVDEVDSVLIDEAQTPLIISDNIPTPVDKYILAAEITDYLDLNVHYKIDEKNKNVILTEQGSKQIEQILSVQDLYNPNDPWIPYIINALKANALYFNNVHYIVQNNRIIIVDEFTGRIMPDRRWGDGLHQAVEAKEKLPIRQKTETVAAITYQNFFLLYPKLGGMTGTGKTAEIEFEKIYNLSVEEIPTARPTQRKDLPDLIYKDQFSKWNAIAQTCNQISSTGQPILIGTTTVEKSEMLAQLLSEYKLTYQILNAKPENVRRESEIVAQAGQKR